jgi:glutathione S-transferase
MFFCAGPFEAAASNRVLGFVVPPERERMMGYGKFETVVKTLEDVLSSVDYLVGNRFTAADLYVGAQIGYGMMFGTLEPRPAFERYWQRMSARPAFKRAQQLDEAEAAKLKKASV